MIVTVSTLTVTASTSQVIFDINCLPQTITVNVVNDYAYVIAEPYVLLDRETGLNVGIQLNFLELQVFTNCLGIPRSEPILQDNANTSDYWVLYAANGKLGIEKSDIPGTDLVTLRDINSNVIGFLIVYDGQLEIGNLVIPSNTVSLLMPAPLIHVQHNHVPTVQRIKIENYTPIDRIRIENFSTFKIRIT